MNKSSDMYQIISKLVNFRKQVRLWEKNQIQRYADDNFYAFSRDKILCLFTNTSDYLIRTITYHPFSENDKLCNLFDISECVYVRNNQIQVKLGGDFKVYILS
jgi:alpha-amylase